MPADARVEDRRARHLDRLREFDHLVARRAALDKVEHGEAIDDDEIRPHPFTRPPHDFDGKAHAVGIVAAPGVVAVVGARRDEFVDQIAFGAHDLHAVIAGMLGKRRAAGEILDRLLDLIRRQRMRAEKVDRRLDGAWRDQLGLIGIAAEMQDLHGDLAAFGMHGLRDHAVMIGLILCDQHRATLHRARPCIRRNAAGDDQADLAPRPFGIEGCHALETVGRFLQPDMHRAHQNAVPERREAEIERCIQMRIVRRVGHGSFFHCRRGRALRLNGIGNLPKFRHRRASSRTRHKRMLRVYLNVVKILISVRIEAVPPMRRRRRCPRSPTEPVTPTMSATWCPS